MVNKYINKIKLTIQSIKPVSLIFILSAFLVGWWISSPVENHSNHGQTTVQSEAEVWTCSMHPNVRLPEPGQCPICFMDLIPLESDAGGLSPDQLSLSKDAVKLAEITTVPVRYGTANMNIRLSGKVVTDETRIRNITAWFPGRLERMFVDYTGITVNKGDHMVEIYSPELYSAQEELIQARKLMDSNGNQSSLIQRTAETTLEATREKLRLLGLMDEQIQTMETMDKPSNIVTVYSPITGVVIKKNGVEGAYVQTGTTIYTIADLSRVWIILDAYEQDIPWLAFGQTVTFNTESLPGKKFEGKISFIDPVLNENTRTVKVRINVLNPNGLLKPGMFVHGNIHAVIDGNGKAINPELAGKWICPMHPEIVKNHQGICDVCGMDLVISESLGIVHTADHQHESLLIPATAVLRTGERAIVYVKLPGDEPIFEGREVVLGPRVGEHYIVRSGLTEGEQVVVRGNFKIDSAMQIAAKPSMMNPKGGSSGMEHNHGGKIASGQTHSEQDEINIEPLLEAFSMAKSAFQEGDSAKAKEALSAVRFISEKIKSKHQLKHIEQYFESIIQTLQHLHHVPLKRDVFDKIEVDIDQINLKLKNTKN